MRLSHRVLPLFLTVEAILYAAFLVWDVTIGGRGSNPIKFAGILLCLVYALYLGHLGGSRLVPAALALTALADVFLLLLDADYALGILLFCAVQGLYFVRIVRSGGRSLWGLRLGLFLLSLVVLNLLGLLIPLLGIGGTNAIVALIIYALMPMVRNTYVGLTDIDPDIIEAARGMGSTRLQTLVHVRLPMATSVILAGLRSMVVMTISVAGIAAFIGAGGLGVAIFRGITTYNLAMTLAGSVLIALLAIVVDLLLGLAEKSTRRHLEPSNARRRKRSGARRVSRRKLAPAVAAGAAVVLDSGRGLRVREPRRRRERGEPSPRSP